MALFNPDAKNPPNGPIVLAKSDNIKTCACSLFIAKGIKSAKKPI